MEEVIFLLVFYTGMYKTFSFEKEAGRGVQLHKINGKMFYWTF